LTACAASTGVVQGDLNSQGISRLGKQVKKECSEVSPRWPERNLTQKETEGLAQRDNKEAQECASPAIAYVNTVTARDTALSNNKVAKKAISRRIGGDK